MNKSGILHHKKRLLIYSAATILLVASVYFALIFINISSEDYQENITTRIGKSFVINIPSRVSIEFRWQVNKKKSKGLELLEINHIGWIYPQGEKVVKKSTSYGSPRTAKFHIQTKAPGVSRIAFEYKRRGIADDTPMKVRNVTINIVP